MNTNKRFSVPIYSRSKSYKSQKYLWEILLGLPLIGLGMAIGLQSCHSTLECDRTPSSQIECKLIRQDLLGTLLGRERSENYLGVLEGADAVVSMSTSGPRYQAILRTNQGITELDDLSQAGRSEDLADLINDFMLDGQEPILTIHQDDRWFSGAFGGILMTIGIGKLFPLAKSKPPSLPFAP